jgi:FkbM family methyltransferase
VSAAGTVAIVALGQRKRAAPPRPGAFDDARRIDLPEESYSRAAIRKGIELARRADARWVVVLPEGVALAEDSFELAAPALGIYDAVFGAAHVRGSDEAVARLTRLAFDEPERLPHALLNWWMPDAHLVRTDIAAGVVEHTACSPDERWKHDYLFELWRSARCLKSAQPLLLLDSESGPLDGSLKADVLRRLEVEPVFLPVIHGDATYELPYTGRNAGIEREQSRGLFFEASELEELRKVVKPGAHVVDVGANTGNHTIFFAGPMKAASVIPFEPLPAAASALRAAVERNGLKNVDLSRLGVGVSDRDDRAALVFSGRGGLGATSLVAKADGEIVVAPLDSMVTGRVDLLKIDVEGMELKVLAGAARLISRSRPLIFIEVANRNTNDLMAWLKIADYRVARIFTDKGHANYLLAPGSNP